MCDISDNGRSNGWKPEQNKYNSLPKKACRYSGMLSAVVAGHRYNGIRVFPTVVRSCRKKDRNTVVATIFSKIPVQILTKMFPDAYGAKSVTAANQTGFHHQNQ
jgi:hypothetical protein